MAEISSGILLFLVVLIGFVSAAYAIYSPRYAGAENKRLIGFRAAVIVLLVVGYAVHTLGDYLTPMYGESAERGLESVAHVIIFAAFVLFFFVAKEAVRISKEYGFR